MRALVLIIVAVSFAFCYKNIDDHTDVQILLDEFTVEEIVLTNENEKIVKPNALPGIGYILVVFRLGNEITGSLSTSKFSANYDLNDGELRIYNFEYDNSSNLSEFEKVFIEAFPKTCYYKYNGGREISLYFNDCEDIIVLET